MIMTLTVEKPLNVTVETESPNTSKSCTIINILNEANADEVELIFRDLETLKDFAQAIVGFTAKAEMDGQL